MSKKLAITGLVLYLLFPLVALADMFDLPGDNLDIMTAIQGIFGAAFTLFTATAIVSFVYAGILFLTAEGDTSIIATARKALLWGIIGVVVAILAYSLPLIVITFLGV